MVGEIIDCGLWADDIRHAANVIWERTRGNATSFHMGVDSDASDAVRRRREVEMETRGVLAEWAFGILVGQPFELMDGDGGYDFLIDGQRIDVKATKNLSSPILVKSDAQAWRADLYVSVWADIKTMRAAVCGHATADTLRAAPHDKRLAPYAPARCLSELTPGLPFNPDIGRAARNLITMVYAPPLAEQQVAVLA